MEFKKTKMAVAALMLVSLSACANNRNDITGKPQHVSTGDLRSNNVHDTARRDMNRLNDNFANRYTNPINNNAITGNNRNGNTNNQNGKNGTMRANDVANSLDFFTSEITPMNYGFITIDPNSYSTSTPSSQFPHTNRVQQGNHWYYTFSPENGQRTYTTPQASKGTVPLPSPGTATSPNGTTGGTAGQGTAGGTAGQGTMGGTQGAPTQAPQSGTAAGSPGTASSTAGISQMAMQVIQLTNNERRKAGLAPLTADPSLSKVAQVKTNDMETKHYFSHTSPTYGSPFDMMRDFGITYSSAGENIAMGQNSAQQVVSAWMNSEGHRKNILSPNYTNIGVGYTQTGNYWSQMFVGK